MSGVATARALGIAGLATALAWAFGAGVALVVVMGVAGLLLERLVFSDLAGRLWRGAAAARVLARASGPVATEGSSCSGAPRTTAEGAGWDDYLPVGPPRRTLVVVHGVTVLGPRDPRLVRFARSFATAGFRVAAPALEGLRRFDGDPADVERLRAVIRACAEEDGAPVAVVGFSFGGGVALAAAAEPALRSRISQLLLLGAHHDIRPLVEAAGATDEPPWDQPRALDGVLYERLLRALAAPEAIGLDPAGREALDDLLARWCVAATDDEKRLFYEQHVAGRPVASPAMTPEAFAALSPAGRLAGLETPVTLLHDRDDPIVPADHARRLFAELAARGPGHQQRIVVTPLLDHVAARDLWRITDLLRVLDAFGALFERASAPSNPSCHCAKRAGQNPK